MGAGDCDALLFSYIVWSLFDDGCLCEYSCAVQVRLCACRLLRAGFIILLCHYVTLKSHSIFDTKGYCTYFISDILRYYYYYSVGLLSPPLHNRPRLPHGALFPVGLKTMR